MKLGDASSNASDRLATDFGAAFFAGAFFFARTVFAGFFAAMSLPPDRGGYDRKGAESKRRDSGRLPPLADRLHLSLAVLVDSPPVGPVTVLGLLALGGIVRLLQGVVEEDFPLGHLRGGDPSGLGDLLLLLCGERTRLRALGVRGAKPFHGELIGGFRRFAHEGMLSDGLSPREPIEERDLSQDGPSTGGSRR